MLTRSNSSQCIVHIFIIVNYVVIIQAKKEIFRVQGEENRHEEENNGR